MVGVISKYLFITVFTLLEETLLNRIRSCTNLSSQKMPTKSGRAWYKLRSGVSKTVRMEHHHLFLKSCFENGLIPHGLHTSVNIAFDLGPDILQSYAEDNASFILYRLNKLIADTFRSWRNLQEQLQVIKRKILHDFVQPIVSKLFQRTYDYQTKLQRKLKNRRRKKLNDLKRKYVTNPLIASKSDCTKEPHNYNFSVRVDNLSDSSFQCDTLVNSDFSRHLYFDFSDPIDFGQHVVHPINLFNFNCNYNKRSRRFDKAHRNNSLHPSHHPIDLSSRSGVLDGEIDLLSKGPSFCPTPSDINWYKCHLDWQAFVD